ncbi:hypothetical protein NEPAR04_2385 [Nematocida parisii]|nr:hypothetical protein NEPAR08_1262 [Nematocida parisii]KAI5128462.1 hypothetical protein NEPAR03_1316 [Nematocida parisii]KAI5145239.1 hypothetical protein NEPAR04_2385 [Nematocida parisii]
MRFFFNLKQFIVRDMRRSTKYIFIIGMLIIKLSFVYTANEQKEEADSSNQGNDSKNKLEEINEIIKREKVGIYFLKQLNDEIQNHMNFYLNKNKFINHTTKKSTSLESANPSTENTETNNAQPSIIYQSIYKAIEKGDIAKNISDKKTTTNYKIVDIPVFTPHIETYYKEVVDVLRRIILMSASTSVVTNRPMMYDSFSLSPESMAKYFLSLISTPYVFSQFDFNGLLKHDSPNKYLEMIKDAKNDDELNSLMSVIDNASHEACRFFTYVSSKIYEFMKPEKQFTAYIKKRLNITSPGIEPRSDSQAEKATKFLISEQCFYAWRAKAYAFTYHIHELFVAMGLILYKSDWDLSKIHPEMDGSNKDEVQDFLVGVYKMFNLLKRRVVSKELFQDPEQIIKIRDEMLTIGLAILELMKEFSLTLHTNAISIGITKIDLNNPGYLNNLKESVIKLWNVATVIKNHINIPTEYQSLSIDEYTERLEKDLITLDNKTS